MPIADIASWVLISAGSFFLVVGAIGLIRMPDVFTRMHSLSVSETAGVGLMIAGMMLQSGWSLVTFKLFCLFLLIFLTAPVASHAIARAALADGVEPLLDGPELDARDGDPTPIVGRTQKLTTTIEASDARASASVLIDDIDVPDPDGKGERQ